MVFVTFQLFSVSFQAEDEADPASPIEPDNTHLMELAEAPSGMRDSDLRSMKDQLLIETSELLGVHLPHLNRHIISTMLFPLHTLLSLQDFFPSEKS